MCRHLLRGIGARCRSGRILMIVQAVTLFIFILNRLQVTEAKTRIIRYYEKPDKYYPKGTVFEKAQLFEFGCNTYIWKCPRHYKHQILCARKYDGEFKTFDNYCAMEYENCISWKKWTVLKMKRC